MQPFRFLLFSRQDIRKRVLRRCMSANPSPYLSKGSASSQAFGDPTVIVAKPKPKSKGWEPPSPQELSKLLAQYEVDMLLGRGGMGAVYKGKHRTLDRVVAIKILPPEMDDIDESYAVRFKNEARAMARLSHPNIVSVYDFGEAAGGLLYFVMEFIEGLDVHKMLKEQGRLQSNHVKNIVAQVCDALDYAHEMKIIHRDIKPANIMVGYDGRVKVADFGLAKITQGSDACLTQSNALLGTLHYMAPEALMLGTSVDHRADIFAVGVMLYQMLTGKLPQGMFEMPSKKVEGVEAKFDAIIGKALMEDRTKRYQTIAEMRADFAEILAPLATQKHTRRTRSASDKLGRYRIVTSEDGKPVLLGTGSAGKTYKAVHSLLGTTVALKVIHEALAFDAEVRQRFLNEAKAIAKLKHPHIAQLVDCDEDDGALFCAIEYCDGGDLERLVAATGALSDETVLLFGRQAAKALAYVHDQGFLHRDLKPSNLMLSMVPGTNSANIKLIDFGLVKALGQTSGLTRKGHFRGTLLYTSPEQLREEELDERADVFSLGMTLWYMLIGRLPMENNSTQITKSRLSGASHAEELPATLHPAIRALLRQMLQPDRNKRARNMHVVLAGIDESLVMVRRNHSTPTRRRIPSGNVVRRTDETPTEVRRATPTTITGGAPSSSSSAQPATVRQDAAIPEEELRTIISNVTSRPGKSPPQVPNNHTKRGEPARQVFELPLAAKFQLLDEFEGVNPEMGVTYRAMRLSNRDMVRLTLLHPQLANDRQTAKALRDLLEKASNCPGEFLVRPLTMIRFTDHPVLVEEMVDGARLLELLRARQRLSLGEAAPLLMRIAEACDQASSAGIPALDLVPHHVVLQFPSLTRNKVQSDKAMKLLSMPLTQWPQFSIRLALDYSSSGDGMAWRFARCAYHLLSGLPPPPPSASRSSYVAVAGISEEANRLLHKVVSGELVVEDCAPFMRRLLQMENAG